MATDWTEDQRAAIYTKWIDEQKTKSCSILVNAAAGSGKTAVLVERIIRKLIPVEDNTPIDVDRLLVVTFTNAAAGEMEQRISAALLGELKQRVREGDVDGAAAVKRQLSLLSSASITTIDAFCIRVVRNYFHLLDIDPSFTVADSAELELMKDETLEEMFERLYEEKSNAFIELICRYSDGRDDSPVAEMIKSLSNFVEAFPDPEGKLYEMRDMYLAQDISKTPWWSETEEKKNMLLRGAERALYTALEIIVSSSIGSVSDPVAAARQNPPLEENDIYLTWGTRYQAVYDEYFRIKELQCADWDTLYEALGRLDFVRLNSKPLYKDPEKAIDDDELKERVGELRDFAKKTLTEGLKKTVFADSKALSAMIREGLYPIIAALTELTVRFRTECAEKKAKRGILEFSDAEHLTLRLFRENDAVREEFKEKYEEILMDEYQDSNALQEAIFTEISRGDNMFMVGDMKQSIYRFRSSDPTLFKQKSDTYEKRPGAEKRKIVLSKNFRSRYEVLEGINDIFRRIMSERVGELEYDADQQLNLGDDTYQNVNTVCGGYTPECLIAETAETINGEATELDALSKERLEARMTARKIREMLDSGYLIRYMKTEQVPDGRGGMREKKTPAYRPIECRDIVIIMSSFKYVSAVYAEELAAFGIECFAESSGYFERNEIKLMTALLKIINNPYSDIPLLGVLRSPVGDFTDDELTLIRINKEGRFFTALKSYAAAEYAEKEYDGELCKKCDGFLKRLESWRSYTKYMPSHKLIWTLYEETGFYDFCGALYGGEDAQANLRLLFERAKSYENTGYKGLFNFTRYLERLKSREQDLSAASTIAENRSVVRIMTIHKSKGLEFPVVFFSGMGKKFNRADLKKKLALHKDLGIGLDYADFEKSYSTPSLPRIAILDRLKSESVSEEIRKLYVALTRAKEKLIVTAVVSGRKRASEADADRRSAVEKCEEKWDAAIDADGKMSEDYAAAADCFIDLVAPAVRASKNWYYKSYSHAEIAASVPEIPPCTPEAAARSAVAAEEAERLLSFKYPDEADIPNKISVTEIKSLGREEYDLTLASVPEFMAEEGELTPAMRGTAMHCVMQNIRLCENMSAEYISSEIRRMCDRDILSAEEARGIRAEKIVKFFASELGRRLIASKRVWRERAFELEVDCAEIPGMEAAAGKGIIVQGVIDCCFEEEDGTVIIDFKSDRYTDPAEIREKYTMQLDYYAKAINTFATKKIKNRYLYLFFDGDVVQC